jgi:RPA family protein
MMATEVVFTNADFAGQGTANTGSEVTATKDGVTFTFSKGYSATESLRCYAHGALTISAESTIEKINFTTTGGKTGGLAAEVAVGATTYSVADLASQARFTEIKVTLEDGGGVEPGDEPTVLQAVSDSTTWDFSKITANTANALYNKEGIQLTDESTPSKNDEVIYADYSEDFMTIGEDFNKAAIAFKGEYPIRKNQYCQAGTLHFKADVAGTIVVKFSDTGSSASATAVKRYLVVNGEQTEYWTSRENNGETPYDAQLNVVSDKIAVPAGDVTITGSSAIVVHYVTFVPEKQDEPVLADPTNCAEAAEAALSVSANNELYNNGASYTITGYVTSIAYAWKEGSMSFWMADTENGGNVLEAYKCAIANEADAVLVGDKVAVTGQLTKYNSTPEFAAGCTVEILQRAEAAKNLGEKTIAEFLALKNTKDTCILTGVVANIQNEEYGNFDLVDETGSVYIYGLLTPEGESKKFADLNVAEKDTLTVLAIYNEYNGNPQAKNAIFVEVKKAPKAPAQDIEITLSSLTNPGVLIWTDVVAEEGWWQIMGTNEAYDFSISNVSTTETAGVYTVADLDADYSYISLYSENDTTDVAFVDGSVTVAVSTEGIVTVNGTLVGSDGNNYIFNLTYKDPTAENTVNVEVPEWQLVDDYVAYLSLFAVAGEDANGTYVQLALNMPDGATAIAGDYTEEDFDLQYFGCYVADANNAYRIFSATIKVAQNEDGKVFVTADILCYNNTLYKVTTPAGQGLSNTAVETKATKSLRNGILVIEKAGVKYNAQGAVIR